MINRFRSLFDKQYQALRSGQAFQFGPLSVLRTSHLAGLKARVGFLEQANRAGLFEHVVRERSVVFLHNSYYNFYYLAQALRRRGWDAISVSVEAPDGEHARFYHGNDRCIYDADPFEMNRQLQEFLGIVSERYRMIHFYGRGQMSLFRSEFDYADDYSHWPFDFAHLKTAGLKIGYSICGCLDGVSQTAVRDWSGCCDRCVWQKNSAVCSNRRNLAWGHKVQLMCDLIATEGFPALDYQQGQKVFREPLTTALDPDFWRPDLEVPENYRLARAPGELIVYHAVGNYELRAQNGRNIKGTAAVVEAIERLRSEGLNVRLEFATNVPSTEVRFLQVQADIIVDQLNHGRYGATAREGMMLGRPTVCYIDKSEPGGGKRLESIETCPLVSATETTIYQVLKDLLGNTDKRARISKDSREFALKWHAADACAARFERVYDGLFTGDRVDQISVAAGS